MSVIFLEKKDYFTHRKHLFTSQLNYGTIIHPRPRNLSLRHGFLNNYLNNKAADVIKKQKKFYLSIKVYSINSIV